MHAARTNLAEAIPVMADPVRPAGRAGRRRRPETRRFTLILFSITAAVVALLAHVSGYAALAYQGSQQSHLRHELAAARRETQARQARVDRLRNRDRILTAAAGMGMCPRGETRLVALTPPPIARTVRQASARP